MSKLLANMTKNGRITDALTQKKIEHNYPCCFNIMPSKHHILITFCDFLSIDFIEMIQFFYAFVFSGFVYDVLVLFKEYQAKNHAFSPNSGKIHNFLGQKSAINSCLSRQIENDCKLRVLKVDDIL